MSNIDKRALRESAEKATSGKWERGDGDGNGGELLVYCDDALGSAVCEMTSEYNAIPKYQRINNLNFIALANPATVLALLDELEAKDKLNTELMEKQRLIDICQGQGLEYRIAAEKRAEEAEKRIAELQALARGVKQYSEFQICHYGATEDYAKGYIDCQNNYNKVLFAAAGKGE